MLATSGRELLHFQPMSIMDTDLSFASSPLLPRPLQTLSRLPSAQDYFSYNKHTTPSPIAPHNRLESCSNR